MRKYIFIVGLSIILLGGCANDKDMNEKNKTPTKSVFKDREDAWRDFEGRDLNNRMGENSYSDYSEVYQAVE
ncbi:hypothetical protein [Sporosarcina pasteurii]|uniref:Lipoprotein n=1 Tax=Sporosarcina pasteurii TaxID=1474 RepID=A0A380BR03_SPOPA|nr:hypothetical protein [Sporosarcina pasteurii]MDS9471201.1 hypothetical protein [Sporosarcina pasteurii]QBQ05163.1 hypothetical protein E2C16_05530 [Sporosarcina pasteurii]SUJ05551.1 Uncharacterised protein [Sporosarcina pasteurii]